MTLKDYLIFFRWKNVLMILLIQFLFKYILFEKYDIQVSLDPFHFALLAFSIAFIGIAGYIINDLHDVKADIINKPDKLFVDKKLTRITAQNLFIGFNSVGLLLGMYLSYHIGHTSYFIIYVLTSLLLYLYAKFLKKKLFTGNVTIAVIVFFCIVMAGVFDVAPASGQYNIVAQKPVLTIILLYGIFGLSLTFIREIVKDIEDIEGDKAIQARSFVIVLGEKKTKVILICLVTLTLLAIGALIYLAYGTHLALSAYLGALLSLPLLYAIYLVLRAHVKSDFHRISGLLKVIMLLGMLSVICL